MHRPLVRRTRFVSSSRAIAHRGRIGSGVAELRAGDRTGAYILQIRARRPAVLDGARPSRHAPVVAMQASKPRRPSVSTTRHPTATPAAGAAASSRRRSTPRSTAIAVALSRCPRTRRAVCAGSTPSASSSFTPPPPRHDLPAQTRRLATRRRVGAGGVRWSARRASTVAGHLPTQLRRRPAHGVRGRPADTMVLSGLAGGRQARTLLRIRRRAGRGGARSARRRVRSRFSRH